MKYTKLIIAIVFVTLYITFLAIGWLHKPVVSTKNESINFTINLSSNMNDTHIPKQDICCVQPMQCTCSDILPHIQDKTT